MEGKEDDRNWSDLIFVVWIDFWGGKRKVREGKSRVILLSYDFCSKEKKIKWIKIIYIFIKDQKIIFPLSSLMYQYVSSFPFSIQIKTQHFLSFPTILDPNKMNVSHFSLFCFPFSPLVSFLFSSLPPLQQFNPNGALKPPSKNLFLLHNRIMPC